MDPPKLGHIWQSQSRRISESLNFPNAGVCIVVALMAQTLTLKTVPGPCTPIAALLRFKPPRIQYTPMR